MSLPKHAEVVVIGGGAIGYSVAYQLTKLGITDVLVLDKDSLVKGATGRNGGGVRAQWTSKENIELAKRSKAMFQDFAKETGHNLFYRKSGYLFVVRDELKRKQLETAAAFQREHGVNTRMIGMDKVRSIVPGINTEGLVGASWNPDDAILFPWPLVWGWKEQAEARGAKSSTFTEVVGFETSADRITKVRTTRGDVSCTWVVNAAGAWSSQISALGGLPIPNLPERHEILVTEPLKPFLKPMLVDLGTGLYLNQDMRGEVIGGLGTHHHPSLDWSSSLDFLKEFSRLTLNLLPHLGPVNVLRQWAGGYDKTPDAKPNLGVGHKGPENLVQANGFSGHGMMISPMVGKVIAQSIAGQKVDVSLAPYSTARFEQDLEIEGMVIG